LVPLHLFLFLLLFLFFFVVVVVVVVVVGILNMVLAIMGIYRSALRRDARA
jgi:hypothetical protein